MSRGQPYRLYVLVVLTLVYAVNIVDRHLIILLLEPIKHDLRLSDTQLGFVTGIAFGLFYATLGVPIARWADRGNRATVTSLAIGLWGLTVMASMFVASFAQLVAARMGAAVGEAGAKPPTYSLVGDYFPEPSARTRAMTVYLLSSPLSALVAYPVAGWLNDLYGWRATFLLMGIPGLVLAAVVKLTVREPRSIAGVRDPASYPAMRSVVALLWRRRTCRHLTLALILLYMMGLGLTPWYGAFLTRSHGLATRELSYWMGLIFTGGGIAGIVLGGFTANHFFAGRDRSQLRLTALAVILLVPCFAGFLLLQNTHASLLSLSAMITLLSVYLAPTYVLLQRLVPDEMRATTMAVVMLLANLLGMGIGPQLVGVLSDLLKPSLHADSLRYAMLIVSLIALGSGCYFWRAGNTVEDDLRAAESVTT